uniref:Uncharacterized protein n=1 Tax=Oryza meridionalis TaxID=40149 RepID=A0A0E0DUK9_9ORYZ
MDRKVYFPSSQEKQSREERGGGNSTVQSNRKPIRSLSPLSSPIPNIPRKPCNSKMRGFLARGLGFYLVSDLDAFMVF